MESFLGNKEEKEEEGERGRVRKESVIDIFFGDVRVV